MSSKTAKPLPPWLVPGYPPLKGEDVVGKASVEGQVVYYPKVVRSQVDNPIQGQKMGCVSLMLFEKPRKFKSGKPVYGFFKIRGNWSTQEQAISQSAKIVREQDSKYKVRLAPVGHWLPITDQESSEEEKIDVRMKKDEVHLRDEAAREKRTQQRTIMRELREREEELKSDGDIYDDPESLRYYSMRRVTEMKLTEQRDKLVAQLDAIGGTLRGVRKELKRIEVDHSDYIKQWLDCYNEEREKNGIPAYIPAEGLFKEYESTVFESLEDTDSEDEEGSSRS